MKLTIGMPIHNATEFVGHALDCAIQNAESCSDDFQLIIVNDFSNEATLEIIQSKLSTVKQSKLFHTHEMGCDINPNVGLAMNTILDQTRAEDDYCMIVESDVYLQPDCINLLAEEIKDDPVAYGAFPEVCSVEGVPTNEIICEYTPHWHTGYLLLKGAIARDTRLRIDAQTFRGWFQDRDLGMCIHVTTGLMLKRVIEARAFHVFAGSTREFWTNPPPVDSYEEALRKVVERWG